MATPIGTLGDASPRAREVLGAVSVIACEDTRTTRKLLGLLGVAAPELVALHAHNEERAADALAARAREVDIALVSDAGTPAISDPGTRVVAAAHRLGVEVRTVPGPSALVAALAASGFPAAPSTFLGFAPRKGREGFAREALSRPETWACFEAPGRVGELVERLAALAPEREACLCRELSKRFEEVVRAPLAALATALAGREALRGECVLVVGPGEALAAEAAPPVGADAGLKEVAAALAARWERPRREVYQALLALEAQLIERPS